ncbi:GNAT family N-acetyltransferase [Microbacterium sp. NPDC091313]
MWIECFAQDERIDGDDADALVAQLLAHVRAAHEVPYSDDDIRAWARNFVEATERQTGPTERRDTIGSVDVRPVTPDRIDDWLQLFDHEAFPDNPDWASCYCLSPHSGEDAERPWRDIRAEMIERLRAGATVGYLAYVDGHVAGWVNASPRATYRKYAEVDPAGPDPAGVAGVSCFVIAPPYRRHGVSSALLDRVVTDAAARGVRHIEAYPVDEDDGWEASRFRGPREMFAHRGFQPVEHREGYTVLRRDV